MEETTSKGNVVKETKPHTDKNEALLGLGGTFHATQKLAEESLVGHVV